MSETQQQPKQEAAQEDKFSSFLPEALAKAMKNPAYVDRVLTLIKGAKLQFTEAELQIIAAKCPDQTTNIDFAEYIYYCAKQGLNPILNDVHLEYKKSKEVYKAIKVVHFNAYLKALVGKHNGFKQVEGNDPNCTIALLRDPNKKNPISGYYVDTILHLKGIDHPIESRTYYLEYAGTDMYNNKPFTMTGKVSMVRTCRLAGILEDTYSEEEAAAWVDTGSTDSSPVNPTPTDDFKVGEKAAAAPPKEEPKTEPKQPETQQTAPPAPPKEDPKQEAPAPEPPKAEDKPKQEPKPVEAAQSAPQPEAPPTRPKVKERTITLMNETNIDAKLIQPALTKIFCAYFGVAEPAELPDIKADTEPYHVAFDKLFAALRSEQAVMVREYVTKDPKTLGTFLAGKLTTLPLLPGFQPPKITPTPEQFMTMFGKPEIGWDDVLATKAAAYCKVRGLSGKEMSDQLKSLGIRPKDVEILNKFFDIAKISETAFPILADRVVKTKRSLNDWLNILAERMGKSPASATAEELDAAIADLPEMV